MRVLGRLKGASMKIGQILSADPDLVPPEYAGALSTLQRSAPPMTYATVKSQIESALDRPLETVFRYFDPDPAGAASIGQVHRGTLQTGQDVAVKVQYPGIVESLDSDIKNLASLMSLGRAVVNKERLDEYLDECRRVIHEEADYVNEAANLRRWSERAAELEGIRIPAPVEEWTRPSVLMMEYIEGQKLDEALSEMEDRERIHRLLARFVRVYAWMFHEMLEIHGDPHPGNFILDADDNLVILDFGCVGEFSETFADGILDVLVACWEEDDEAAASAYRQMGFGKNDADASIFKPRLLREYHELILEPFLTDGPFDFGAWSPRTDIQRFVLKNPSFLKLVPPAEALIYFRVLSGIKGLVSRLGAQLDVKQMAVETARRRGRLDA
jgi:predicted unusual protein kinase regulating ubiquinone biosynthesis (AarF/ABC1/UbiB family)